MTFRIQNKEIVYGQRLGAGGFGEVFQATWNHTNVAVKQLYLKNLSETIVQEFQKEVDVHLNLRHPNIVQMYGVTSHQPYGMVMEFMENGSLDHYLQKNPPQNVSWTLKYKIASAVSKALLFLHKNGIIHRDLKSLNVLLNEVLMAKICDFGLAKVKTETKSKTGFAGTIQWSAPELFKLKPVYNEKTDIYSYGITLWELASHEYPYKETPVLAIPSLVKDGERETFPENTPKAFEKLAKKCWDGQAEKRPELESVIVTLESLLATSNETKQTNTYASSYLFSSPPNQNNNNSGYLQSTTNHLVYLNPFTNHTNPFQPNMPHIPYPINLNPFTINNSPIHQTPQPQKPQLISPPKSPQLPSCAFGATEWKKYFGDVGVEPPLPKDIDRILSSPCPFWPSKKVQETHLLVLVPQTVSGKPLNLKTLGELVKKPFQGPAAQYRFFDIGEYIDPAAPSSHWVLMTRDVIEGSCGRKKTYQDQQKLLNQKGHGDYAVPTVLDATVCIFMEHVRSGTRLYSDSPWTCTRCQEKYDAGWQLVVGGFFASGGLGISNGGWGAGTIGIGGCRRFV